MSRHIIDNDGVSTLVEHYGLRKRQVKIRNHYRHINIDLDHNGTGFIEVSGDSEFTNGYARCKNRLLNTQSWVNRALLMTQKGCVIYAESDIDHYILDIKCPEFEYRATLQ